MIRTPLVLALVFAAATASAQAPLRVTSARRPPRDPGVVIFAPARRVVPAWERALTHANVEMQRSVGPRRWGLGAIVGTLVGCFGAAMVLLLLRGAREAAPGPVKLPRMSLAPHPGVELRRLSIAFDWKLRAFVQHSLAQARALAPPGTPRARVALVAALRDALARSRASLRAAHVETWLLAPSEGAPRAAALARELAARDAEAPSLALPPGMTTEDGHVVVSLVAVIRSALSPTPPRVDAPTLFSMLDALADPRAERLLHAEVIWSPGDEETKRSPNEVTRRFPELNALG